MSPLDFYDDLTESWSKTGSNSRPIYDKLRYELEKKRDLEFEYVLITGVHGGQKSKQSGSINLFYPHIHLLVYIDGKVDESVFHPVIDKHVKHSPVASENQHDYSDAIRVEKVSDIDLKPMSKRDRVRGLVTPAARDISSHLPKVGINNGQLTGSLADKLFAAMMFSTNRKSWKDSDGFREAYKSEYRDRTGYDPDSSTNEEYEHIGYEIDGDVVESTDGGGSSNFMTISEPIPDFYKPSSSRSYEKYEQ
jgi:hypothetical protein